MNYYLRKADTHLVIVDEAGRTIDIDTNDFVVETVKEFLLQDMKPELWGFYTNGEYSTLISMIGNMDILPKYVKELAQEVDTVQLPDKLIPSKTYNKESDPILKASEYCKWCYRLHKSLSTYQAQLEEQELDEEWKSLAAEMEHAVKSYEILLNKRNPDSRVEYKLKMQVRPLVTRDALDRNAIISQAILTLEARENGVSRICLNKTFGFRTPEQETRQFDWALKLYREALFDMIANGLIFDQINWDNRDAALASI